MIKNINPTFWASAGRIPKSGRKKALTASTESLLVAAKIVDKNKAINITSNVLNDKNPTQKRSLFKPLHIKYS